MTRFKSFLATVALAAPLAAVCSASPTTDNLETETPTTESTTMITLEANGHTLTAALEDNSSADALRDLLEKGPVVVDAHDYGNQEKVGSLPAQLPRNDEPTDAQPCDLILYQGNQFVIYYAPNSWPFTRLGRIEGVGAAELKEILGPDGVSVTLFL